MCFVAFLCSLCSQLSFDMHQGIFQMFSIFGSLDVIRGHQGSLEVIRRSNICFIAFLCSLGSQLSFDMHEGIVQMFYIFGSLEVIRSHKRSLEVFKGNQKIKFVCRSFFYVPCVPGFRMCEFYFFCEKAPQQAEKLIWPI